MCVRACARACVRACVCVNEVGLLVSVFGCSLILSPLFCSEVGIEIGATYQTGVWVCIWQMSVLHSSPYGLCRFPHRVVCSVLMC